MSFLESNYSENEDDPQVYESSGDEWNSSTEKKRNFRRTSQRLSKKPRLVHVDSSESDLEEEEEEVEIDVKPKKNGVNKRQKVTVKTEADSPVNETSSVIKKESPAKVKLVSTNFVNGGFLILKKDAQSGDPSKRPCLWRIDGKALLQKYEPFEEDGKIKHKNTSIYTGWSALDKDLYHPVMVKVLHHQGQNMVIETDWDEIKSIVQFDSD
ncbi:uncharacterized protein LOC108732418 [Agrilus planipennis]|uniref:Uncharacterized protein LOC108732418 n=1 Tax=Agrilus planipennis TaxID=224129 RepID=A0A1W4W3L1_AGRPL|nr:uncharacterized protein LOC108732418 [Agrilus planipennis]